MNRRSLIGGLSATTAGAFLFYVQSTDEQIITLEEDVQVLDERVSALETQVADKAEPPNRGPQKPGRGDSSSIDVVTVEGVGTTVSDKFTLKAGQYRVNATIPDPAADFVSLTLYVHDPTGSDELVFNEFAEHGEGPWEGSSIYSAAEDGEYFVSVENTTAAWTVVFEPF